MFREANNQIGKQIDFSFKHIQTTNKHTVRGSKYKTGANWKNSNEDENENRAKRFLSYHHTYTPAPLSPALTHTHTRDADATPVKIQLVAKLLKYGSRAANEQSFRTVEESRH